VSKRIIRKGSFRWGESFLTGKLPFPGPKLSALRKYCYERIDELPNGPQLDANGIVASRLPFERHGYGFVLWYDHEPAVWVLDIVTRPLRRRR
jgi:hypothetical protein